MGDGLANTVRFSLLFLATIFLSLFPKFSSPFPILILFAIVFPILFPKLFDNQQGR